MKVLFYALTACIIGVIATAGFMVQRDNEALRAGEEFKEKWTGRNYAYEEYVSENHL